MDDTLFGEPDETDVLVRLLHQQPGWPADAVKDRALVALLRQQYPQINLSDEITKWRGWMLDHESKKEVRHRARFSTWCSKAAADGRRGRAARPGHAAGTRAGGAPSDWTGVGSGVYLPG